MKNNKDGLPPALRGRGGVGKMMLFAILFMGVSPVFAWTENELFSSPANREPTASEFKTVVELLGNVALVEADYSERKEMHLLSQALLSDGNIFFSPVQGLYRKMETPFGMEILINRKEFVQRDANGDVVRMNIAKIAPAKAFIDLFLSLLSGDEQRWEKHFDVFYVGTSDRWQIGFRVKPKSPVARGLRHILISGEGPCFTVVQTLEKNGDQTTTRYSNHHVYLKGDVTLATHSPFPEISSKP